MNKQNLVEFTNVNFEKEVLQSDIPVLVDFWASWCGPCRAIGPAIEKLASEFADTAKVGKLNVDENPEIAERFGISSIPAVLVFNHGHVIETFVGVRPRERYAQAIDQILATA